MVTAASSGFYCIYKYFHSFTYDSLQHDIMNLTLSSFALLIILWALNFATGYFFSVAALRRQIKHVQSLSVFKTETFTTATSIFVTEIYLIDCPPIEINIIPATLLQSIG